MSEDLETINEEKVIEEKVPKKKGRPFKVLEPTDYKPKPRGRPKKTKEDIKEYNKEYYKNYYETHKERIVQNRVEYRKTENYKILRHMQNERYKLRQAQKPKVCLIDIKALEPQKGVCLIKV